MARWQFVLTELNGTQIAELLNASDRRVALSLNRVPVLSGRVRLDNSYADRLLACNVLVKAYRNSVLRFVGPVIAAEEVSDGQAASVAFNAAGPLWRLGHRLIGKTAAGYTHGTAGAPVDTTTLLSTVLSTVNTDSYTGIDAGTLTSTGTTSYVAWAPYKPALEGISEIANALGGPDFEVAPQEPSTVAGGTRIGLLNASAAIGSSKPAAVFEYGVGRKNVASYNRQVTVETMLNAAYGLPSSSDGAGTVVTATDATSITAYGRLEGVVPSDGTADLRQRLVNEHVRIRKIPRQLIRFAPTREDPDRPGRVPQFGVDFIIGDAVPFRAVMRRQDGTVSTRVNASLRIYAVDFTIDDQGLETPTFTLTAD